MSDDSYEYTVKLSRGTKRDDRDTQKVKVRADTIDQLQAKVEAVKEQLQDWASDFREIQPQEDRHLADDQSELGEISA